MDYMFDAYVGYDIGSLEPDDIPKSDEDVWILGKKYNTIQELDLIRHDVQSKIWCTYRKGFVPIGNSQLTSDKGWGCTLRCGQMVLAQALIHLHLGRDWYWTAENKDPTYLKIVNRFEDNRTSPYSLHQIAVMGGDTEDKRIGEWFGPNNVAQVLKKLVKFDEWSSLVIHVALDSTLATDEVVEQCTETDDCWSPLLLIIPLRLGLNEMNDIYIPALKKCFEFEGSCGMIGGRPNQALYFIGYVGEEALFLDPHVVQRSGSIGNKSEPNEIELDETFHQKYANRINFRSMDPSMAICFLCPTRQDFDKLLERFNEDIIKAEIQSLFEITKSRQMPWMSATPSSSSSRKNSEPIETFNELSAAEIPTEEFETVDEQADVDSEDEFEIIY